MDAARATRLAGDLVGRVVDGWRLVELPAGNLGKSALVFKAERDGEIAAIKIFDPELIERFGKDVQEERIRRQLVLRGRDHPNLVRILDGGHSKALDLWFLAMEYLDAPSLATVLDDVPRERIGVLLSQVASAARFLEDLGLVHRDIKPDNVIVTQDFARAVLLDLGVVRPIGIADITDRYQKVFLATLRYSPPEFVFRLEEDSVDGWRAITFYQLGAILHDMIMKKRLFAEFEDPYARLVEAVKYEIPRVEAADVSPDLVLLSRNCLSKDPRLRLRLLKWEDFAPQEPRPSTAADAKERIRKRRIAGQMAGEMPAEDDAEQMVRAVRRVTIEMRGQLQEMIRRECIGGDLFPPLAIHDVNDGDPKVAHFGVVFASSVRYGLSMPLNLWFDIVVLDHQSRVLTVSCSAALGASPGEMIRRSVVIFEGVFEEGVVRSCLQEVVYLMLDRAQEVRIENRPGETVWVEVPRRRAI